MGQQTFSGKDEGIDRRKQIENYWKASKKGRSLRESQDNRIVRQFFDMYDTKGKGKLEGEDAITYIQDLLKISGFDKEIMKEAKAQKVVDPKNYYDAYVLSIFHEMDPKMTGAIEFEQLIKPKFHQWMDFLRAVSTKGAREREFLRRLRSGVTNKSPPEQQTEDIKPEEFQQHLEAIDSLWENQMEENDEGEDEENQLKKEILNKDRKALTSSGVTRFRERQLSEVIEILQIDPVVAQALMQFMKWDKEKLLTAYFNDKEKLFRDAGLPLPPEEPKTLTKTTKQNNISTPKKEVEVPKTIECTICFETVGEGEFSGLESCRHYFCNNCWKTNLTEVQIKEGHTIDITCMHQECNNLVPSDFVKKIVDEETYKKYATFLSKSFVEHNTEIRWCPKPGCDRAVVTRTKEGKIVVGKCSCGYQFCWSCMNESHPPITCKMLKDWLSLATGQTATSGGSADPLTISWIAENTKDCPKCGTSIEKNSGCFMMTCSQCGAQWCWMCSQPWSTHSDHFRCSKYRDAVLEDKPHFSKEELEKRKEKLRYAFYYKQYINHDQSLKLESEQKQKAKTLMEQLVAELPSMDPAFVEDAFLQLQECRLTLKYSYVYLYFEEDELNKAAYEIIQSNLEMVTERLAQALNRPVKQLSCPDIRSLTKVALKALVALLTAEPIREHKKK